MTEAFEAECKKKENLTSECNDLKDKVTRLKLDLHAKRKALKTALKSQAKKQADLDNLTAEKLKLVTERDSLKDRVRQLELDHVKAYVAAKLQSDILMLALKAAEEKLKKKQDKLDTLMAEQKRLTQECDDLKNKVTQLELELVKANARAKEELHSVKLELVHQETALEHATQSVISLECRYKEQMAEYKKLVHAELRVEYFMKGRGEMEIESLKQEISELRKEREEGRQLLRAHVDGHREIPGEFVSLHLGNHVNMILF